METVIIIILCRYKLPAWCQIQRQRHVLGIECEPIQNTYKMRIYWQETILVAGNTFVITTWYKNGDDSNDMTDPIDCTNPNRRP